MKGRKKLTRKEKEELSRQAGMSPKVHVVSKYAQKGRLAKSHRNAAMPEEGVDVAPIPRPVPMSVPDGQKYTGQILPHEIRQSYTAMVTGAYRGGAILPAVFLSRPMPPLAEQALKGKPCFIVADEQDGQWKISRYVGELTPNGKFTGMVDTITVGAASNPNLRKAIFGALIGWAQSHGVGRLDRTPQKVFGPAQNVYGMDRPVSPRPQPGF